MSFFHETTKTCRFTNRWAGGSAVSVSANASRNHQIGYHSLQDIFFPCLSVLFPLLSFAHALNMKRTIKVPEDHHQSHTSRNLRLWATPLTIGNCWNLHTHGMPHTTSPNPFPKSQQKLPTWPFKPSKPDPTRAVTSDHSIPPSRRPLRRWG